MLSLSLFFLFLTRVAHAGDVPRVVHAGDVPLCQFTVEAFIETLEEEGSIYQQVS